MLDLIGHAGYLMLFTGTVLIVRKNVMGWWLRAAGELTWFGLGVAMQLSSVILWSLVFLVSDLWGIREWQRRTDARS